MNRKAIIFIISCLFFSCVSKKEKVAHELSEGEEELHLNDQQVQLGHILVDTVKEYSIGAELFMTGTVVANQNKTTVISSRVMGRIEKLYFKNVGDKISKGQAIYDIYSEEISLTINELKLALEKRNLQKNTTVDFEKIISSARKKLMLYGIPESQIDELQRSESSSEIITIKSPVNGVVSSLDINEGNYIMEGGNIMHLEEYSILWVEAEIFSEDMFKIKGNMTANVSFPDNLKLKREGKVLLLNQELNSQSKINLIRVEILNENNILKPGMQAEISILYDKFNSIALPTDAIILEQKGAAIWLQTGHNTYKNIMVQTGIESNGFTQIKSGLEKGDVVVVSGNYLLHSEYTFINGNSTMKGHNH